MDYELDSQDRDVFISHARVRSAAQLERDPLVGDIVHHWDGKACQAAIVTALATFGSEVDVTVLPSRAVPYWAADVPHSEPKDRGTWHWPEAE